MKFPFPASDRLAKYNWFLYKLHLDRAEEDFLDDGSKTLLVRYVLCKKSNKRSCAKSASAAQVIMFNGQTMTQVTR